MFSQEIDKKIKQISLIVLTVGGIAFVILVFIIGLLMLGIVLHNLYHFHTKSMQEIWV